MFCISVEGGILICSRHSRPFPLRLVSPLTWRRHVVAACTQPSHECNIRPRTRIDQVAWSFRSQFHQRQRPLDRNMVSSHAIKTGWTRQTLVVSDNPHQFLSAGKRRQVLSLFFQSPVFGKATDSSGCLQVTSKLRVSFVVFLLTAIFISFLLSLGLGCRAK